MNAFEPADLQPLDSAVVEQALSWMVALQSGVSSVAEQRACQRWREELPAHELAWQRLIGLNQGVRQSTRGLPAAGARELLQARSLTSRRTLLKAFGALGVAVAAGHGVHQRTLLPELFSEHRTATGERRTLVLPSGVNVELDTRTALDGQDRALTLNHGRIRLTAAPPKLTVTTAHGWITTTMPTQLIIGQDLPGLAGTQVQVVTGQATLGSRGGQRQTVGAGQQCLFDRNQAGPLASLPGTALAWTQGMLIAERMPLAQLVAELDRYRRGVLRCDPAVAALQVSGSFSLDRPEASLELLVKVLPVRVQRVAGYWATVRAV